MKIHACVCVCVESQNVKKSASQSLIRAKQKAAREQLEGCCEDGSRLRQLLRRESYKAASHVCGGLKACVMECRKVVDPRAGAAG